MISLSEPVLGEEEKQALCAVIDSGWITMGDRVARLEKTFARMHGVDEAVAVSSCTAGLHLCLAALGLGPGDEVLAPSLTFVATVNAVLYTGATPVLADIEAVDLPHMSIRNAEARISPRTRAVVVMHYGGYLVDLPAWRALADAYGLKLVEDAAHAPAVGEVGKWGDAAAFSFFSNKNMTTAEGGMVVARDGAVVDRMRHMRAHGMTTGSLDRHRGHAYSYDVTGLGYNYRMDELRGALGLVQLERLESWNGRRCELTGLYRKRLAEKIPEISVPFDSGWATSAHLLPVLLPPDVDRETVMVRLRQKGIQTSIHYPPVHRFSYYRKWFPELSLSNTERFAARELTLPLHPGLRDEDVAKVVAEIKSAIV